MISPSKSFRWRRIAPEVSVGRRIAIDPPHFGKGASPCKNKAKSDNHPARGAARCMPPPTYGAPSSWHLPRRPRWPIRGAGFIALTLRGADSDGNEVQHVWHGAALLPWRTIDSTGRANCKQKEPAGGPPPPEDSLILPTCRHEQLLPPVPPPRRSPHESLASVMLDPIKARLWIDRAIPEEPASLEIAFMRNWRWCAVGRTALIGAKGRPTPCIDGAYPASVCRSLGQRSTQVVACR